MTFKARIRGVYSTAITKLLLDNGFEIVQPSPAIRERFELDENVKTPDIDICDRRNRQGIHVVGEAGPLNSLATVFQRRLIDVIFRKQSFPINGIYNGIIKKDDGAESFVYVDIGSAVGKLSRKDVGKNISSKIVVQVQRKRTMTETPWLSAKISIPGEYVILIPEEKIKVSLKIRDMQKRMSLIDFGKRIAPSGWGIIWRTTAANQSMETLEDEIRHLVKIWKDILKESDEEASPMLLWGNQYYMNLEFPALSKASFDEIRAQAIPTVEGHHYYKACGKSVSTALEMAERMLEGNVSSEELTSLFQQTIEIEYPEEGSAVSIEHVKPSGKVYYLGKARIEKIDKAELVYSRVFKNEGFYDSLGIPKALGDRAVTEAKIGGWYYTTRYFSKDGAYKGAHVNLHTPLELYPKWIRYVDLEVDVCALPDGVVKVVDKDELERVVANGFISSKLASLAKEKLPEILEHLDDSSFSKNQSEKE